MGSRVGTARRGSVKAGAVVLAAFIGVCTPGLSPMASAAAQDEAPPWAPPPANIGQRPNDTGAPDKDYLARVACIEPARTEGKNPRDDILKNGPWGQRHLRLREVHEYVKRNSKHEKIGVDERTGKPLKVAVIDTGVTPHKFFGGRVKPGGDYVMTGERDGLKDCDGHGTQVAGIIGGNPQSTEIGFIGVAPDVEIISIRQSSQNYSEKKPEEIKQEKEEAKRKAEEAKRKAAAARQQAELERKQAELEREIEEAKKRKDDGGGDAVGGAATDPSQGGGERKDPERAQGTSGSAGNQNTLAQAIVRAVDKHQVDVINMSVDACKPNQGNNQLTPDEIKLQAAVAYAASKDVVVVAAAGNKGGPCVQNDAPPQDPATGETGKMPDPNHPPTIVTPPWFSYHGDLLAVAAIDETGSVADFSMRGPWVSVAAPGTGIISLDPAEGSDQLVNITFDGQQGIPLQGTSFAAPYVAGLAVLVKQMRPELNAREIMDRIKTTAQHPGAHDGHDQFIGYGVIDPMAALTETLPGEVGLEEAVDRNLPSDMPPPSAPDNTPMIVALAGAGGGFAALGITLFTVHTIRRRRPAEQPASG